jgi:hypothetical protein
MPTRIRMAIVTGQVAPAGIGHGRPGGAGGGRRAVTRALAALATGVAILLAAALLAGCGDAARPAAAASPATALSASARARHPVPAAHRPIRTPRWSPPGPTPGPPAGVAGLRLVGASGRTAWQLTATRLWVSWDAGQHWSGAAVPAGVAPSSITTITAADGRGLWLAVWRRSAIDLYHQGPGSGGWSHRTLGPRLPSSLAWLDETIPHISISLGPANVVTVVADFGLTSTHGYSTLFISSDGGTIFTQHPTNISLFVSSVTFLSAQQAMIVAGPVANDLYRTADGGASWSLVTIPGLPSGPAVSYVSYGTPGIAGTQLLLPVIVTGSSGVQAISIYRSTDAGATFAGPTGPPLKVPASVSAGEVQPAIAGSVIWLPASGRIYQTINAGATWTTVMSVQSAYPISLISGSQAIGTATDSGCRSFKTDCYYYSYLIATNDGGRSWRTLEPAQAAPDTSRSGLTETPTAAPDALPSHFELRGCRLRDLPIAFCLVTCVDDRHEPSGARRPGVLV